MEKFRYKSSNNQSGNIVHAIKQKAVGVQLKIEVKICFLAYSWKATRESMVQWVDTRLQNHPFSRCLSEMIKEIQSHTYTIRYFINLIVNDFECLLFTADSN